MRFHGFGVKREAKTERKVFVFNRKRIRVIAAWWMFAHVGCLAQVLLFSFPFLCLVCCLGPIVAPLVMEGCCLGLIVAPLVMEGCCLAHVGCFFAYRGPGLHRVGALLYQLGWGAGRAQLLDGVGGNPSHWITQAWWSGARFGEVDIAEPSSQRTARPAVSMPFDGCQSYPQHWSRDIINQGFL